MLGRVSAVVALALGASLTSVLWRHRRRAGELSPPSVVLLASAWLAVLGIGTTLLAVLGIFGAISVSVGAGASAVLMGLMAWWRRPVAGRPVTGPPAPTSTLRRWGAPVVLLVLGVGLRWPVIDYPLAGRDQGTYTLRAQHTLRTGGLHAVDPVLASAAEELGERPGPADLVGLYHRHRERWRQDRYEASYRPGFYLADLDGGHVHPQFLHMHPMLMATAGLVLGPSRVAGVTLLYAALSVLGLWAVARRLWPRGAWAELAALLWATAPLSVWVLRTPLSEGPTSVLMLAGTLAVLRARDEGPGVLTVAAVCLGGLSWVRGNGWLAAPVLLAAQWLVPATEHRARRAGVWLAALFAAAVVVHAPTTFPYLYDELLRQLPLSLPLTPGLLVAITLAGLAAWFAVDELGPLRTRESRWLPRMVHRAPDGLAVLLLLGLVAYLALRMEPVAKPFSRLDPVVPLLGIPALGLAALGLGPTLARWPRRPGAPQAWMLGLAGIVVATVGLYAPRNLPRLDLYYYGRYLVPELLPAILLLAVQGLRTLHGVLLGSDPGPRRRRVAIAATVAGALGMEWSVAGVLVRHPVTRLPEFAGAGRVVDHLASRLPPDAVVIAGGEGWHFGHTFNQVGGALAFRHGITVLPYQTREAAYASLTELLVRRPAATGEPAPPVFLLLNEATKHRVRDPKDPQARVRISGIDDLLPPPFVARRIDLVEMVLDRLTPTREGPPVRVTRDGLRMALLRVEVDPTRAEQIESWRLDGLGSGWAIDGPPGLTLEGGHPRDDTPCLGTRPLTLHLPPEGGAGAGPVSLVLVAVPGTAARTPQWSLRIDGHPIALDPPRRSPRHRDTLGPIPWPTRPQTIELRGAKKKTRRARCPRGGLVELHLLGPEAPMLHQAETTAVTFAPARSLGHPVDAVGWVSGRGLSRFRRGIEPPPLVEGLSLVLTPDAPLRFPATALPDGGREPLEVVLTLTRTQVSPRARLEVTVDGQALPPVDPPDERRRSWQSPPLRVIPRGAAAQIEVALRDADPDDHVLLRDIGLFSRAAPRLGRLSSTDGGILDP